MAEPVQTRPENAQPVSVTISTPLRQQLIHWGIAIIASILAALGARYGIQVPPPPVPAPGEQQPAPPSGEPKQAPPDSVPKDPPPDVPNAIVKISSGNVGCSATVIGPRRPDGRYWVLTAAHCVNAPGQRWTMRFRDGRTVGAQVVNFDRAADWAWMVTDGNNVVLPHAFLAEAAPAAGSRIWHAGYGVHIPGNREDGLVVRGDPDANGQVQFRLSVSSGDSGGGIVIDASGHVVSPVCCTTAKGQIADVWGAAPQRSKAGQRDTVDVEAWNPIDMPVRPAVEIPKIMPSGKP